MPTYLEILSQGEEVLTGQVVDTNAAWLSKQAVQLGFQISRHQTVGDKLDDLITVLRDIATRADCCICTGGLGPTCDDLTSEAVALAFNLPLVFDEMAFIAIEQYFKARNKIMPDINRKQALLPKNAKRIHNEWGTAPGFSLHYERCYFIFLPGVPREMENMFLAQVKTDLLQRFDLKMSRLITFKTSGLGESALAEKLKTITIPKQVQLGFWAGEKEVQVKLLFTPDYHHEQLLILSNAVAEVLGDCVFEVTGLND